MNGAQALMRTLADSGIDTLFTNPGTTELHLVEAVEATGGLRSVLALFEGIVSGAADGFGRIAGRPAATLLHLGVGQGNGWANFHNARRAQTPIVSVIGDQATFYQKNDPPLMSDIAALARALHSKVAAPRAAGEVSAAARAAVADATSAPGRISTIVMAADVSWSPTEVGISHLIVAGSRAPVSNFAYPDRSGLLTPDGAADLVLAGPDEDVAAALADLADQLAPQTRPQVAQPSRPQLPAGPLTLDTWPQVIGALLPDNVIVCDETISSGAALPAATSGAPRHDMLSCITGGAMGQGLPLAIGAAIAARDRPVVLLEGDGCAMYTISALWSHARENLDITTVILKNSSYGILREEWTLLREPGQADLHDSPLINLTGDSIDYASLAQSMGVPGSRADTAEEFASRFRQAIAEPGPHLIEITIPAII